MRNSSSVASILFVISIFAFSAPATSRAQAQGNYGYYDAPPPSSKGMAGSSGYSKPSAFDGINYDLFEMGYRYMVFDGDKSLLDDGHAVSLDISLDFLWLFFLEANVLYGTTNTDVSSASEFFDLDESGNYSQLNLGIGAHFPVTDQFHLVASGGFYYENQDLSTDVFDDIDGIIDGGGFYFRPGVRVLLTDQLEAGAFAEFTKLSDAEDGNWGITGDLIYRFNDAVGIGGTVTLKEDVSTFGLGLRLSW